MTDNADILAAVGGEDIAGVAAVNLGCSLDEPVFWRRQETRKGEAGIVDAVFPADEIIGHQWPVNERQGVIVNGVDLAEFGAHLPDFQEQPRRERRARNGTLPETYAGFAEGDEVLG